MVRSLMRLAGAVLFGSRGQSVAPHIERRHEHTHQCNCGNCQVVRPFPSARLGRCINCNTILDI